MDTFTTRTEGRTGSAHHHSDHGFCTVCGTAWPCWQGLRDDAATRRSRNPSPLVATVAIGAW